MLLSNVVTPGAFVRPVPAADHNVVIDIAKGIGILLVVAGHAWRGLNDAHLIADPNTFAFFDALVYNFHMPLFFILSGMTFERWALHHACSKAAWSRVTRLLWPLLLWTYVFSAVRLAAGGHANASLASLSSLFYFPLPARDHFWFLWALFLLHLAFLGLIRFVGKPLAPALWLSLAGLLTLASSSGFIRLDALTVGAATYMGAFVVGIWLGRYQPKLAGYGTFCMAALVFIGFQALSFAWPDSRYWSQTFGILIALAALSMINTVCVGRSGVVLRLLAYLGVCSMGIYLAHTIFSAGVRSFMSHASSDLSLHMLMGVVAGVLGPLLIYAAIRRVGKPSWIGF